MRPLLRLAALSALLLNACYPPGDGKAPPLDEIYFPTGLALDGQTLNTDGAPRYLYLANSDFDLQYRSSSLISYDLDRLSGIIPRSCNTSADCPDDEACDAPGAERLPDDVDSKRTPSYYCVAPTLSAGGALRVCGDVGEHDPAEAVLYPGRCKSIDAIPLKVDSVGIGAFASDVIWRKNCASDDQACSSSRLFIPVRGDSTLHWIDVKKIQDPATEPPVPGMPYQLDCGQNNGDEEGCDAAHRSGDNPDDNDDHLEQNPEPFGVDATENGEFVVVTDQTTGTVSLYHDEGIKGPMLVNIASGLPFAPIGVAAVPKPTFADPTTDYAPSFLVTYRNAPQIDLLRVHQEEPVTSTSQASYTRYTLRRGGSVPINANSLNFDQRGIVIDDSPRGADYDKCLTPPGQMTPLDPEAYCATAADVEQCRIDLSACLKSAQQPLVFAASRAPASMLVGAMTTDLNYESGTSELPSFTDSLPLSVGPSRVVVGKVRVPGTKFHDDSGSYD